VPEKISRIPTNGVTHNMPASSHLTNWRQFDRRIRNDRARLLAGLPHFSAAVLVAGCQRSGTTVLTRILREAIGMPGLGFTRDDELDAALILCRTIEYRRDGRCCFQTTYLNDHYREYFEHDNYQLVWVIRRPEAVVRSMLLHWRRAALRRLFRACAQQALDDTGARRFRRFGCYGFSREEMACLCYNVKTAQLHEIAARLGPKRLYILDYDRLVEQSDSLLPDIFAFAGIPYHDRYAGYLHKGNRGSKKPLGDAMRKRIHGKCDHSYRQAVQLAGSLR